MLGNPEPILEHVTMTCQEDFKHVEQMPSIGDWRCHGTSSDGSDVVRFFRVVDSKAAPRPPQLTSLIVITSVIPVSQ